MLASLLLAGGGAAMWLLGGSPRAEPPRVDAVAAIGEPGGDSAHLLGVQPHLTPADYACAQCLEHKLEGYLDQARRRGWLTPRTVVVLPEYVGAWLVAAHEVPRVQGTRSTATAMALILALHPVALVRSLATARSPDRLREALFRLKAAEVAAIYDGVMSRLAARHRITLVGGSLLLPEPRVDNGHLRAGSGPLYNVSVVYDASGRALSPPVRKVFPTAQERPFVAPGRAADLPVFDTPAGRLGVLLCADSWYPEPYEALVRQGVEILAVPSYVAGDGTLGAPWGGYSGAAAPPDVNLADRGRITEGEAWVRYALPARLPRSVRAAIHVFLRGTLWDLGDDGASYGLLRTGRGVEAAHLAPPGPDGAALVSVWTRP
ncbi:MAG: carbon-nitrogen hydrolase family protein [Myxococcota bacterium]|nr:carbon-nitrogen hydrolase family protein [Myxococcota bacterium]